MSVSTWNDLDDALAAESAARWLLPSAAAAPSRRGALGSLGGGSDRSPLLRRSELAGGERTLCVEQPTTLAYVNDANGSVWPPGAAPLGPVQP